MQRIAAKPIDPQRFGVSFSVKQCRNLGVDPEKTMKWLTDEAGFRRFRLMSYWNECEKEPGTYNFSSLDWQIMQAEKSGCLVTLCLGARQPRWPENHWPEWAWDLSGVERTKALLTFIKTVVERYKAKDCLISYQLENEALLKSFGERAEVNRKRLRQEYNLVKALDPKKPIIMSTSTSWGIPARRPIPDIVGFSFYRILYGKRGYSHAFHFPLLDRLRAIGIRVLHQKPSFIHELQLEPWGPAAIWEMSVTEQNKSMSPSHIQKNIELIKKTKLYPVDLWGGEWWYWRLKYVQDPSIWLAVKNALTNE